MILPYLAVESEAGVGTAFHIYLSASVKMMPGKDEKGKKLLNGRGKVLIMDDEDVILLVMGKMLEELGYEAEFAGNGEKTIEKYVEALYLGRPFDAVIIDLTVRGGMGGKECIRELLKINPHIRAIVSSGYSDGPRPFQDSQASAYLLSAGLICPALIVPYFRIAIISKSDL